MYGFHRAGCGPAFNKNFSGYSQFPPFGMGLRRPKYNVPLNIIENETNFEAHVYATGFSKENIKVSVVDDLLYISGKREIDETAKPNFSRQEFPIKTFERTLVLNGLVDIENISAKVENGILVVTLPKTPQAQKTEQNVEVQ